MMKRTFSDEISLDLHSANVILRYQDTSGTKTYYLTSRDRLKEQRAKDWMITTVAQSYAKRPKQMTELVKDIDENMKKYDMLGKSSPNIKYP